MQVNWTAALIVAIFANCFWAVLFIYINSVRWDIKTKHIQHRQMKRIEVAKFIRDKENFIFGYSRTERAILLVSSIPYFVCYKLCKIIYKMLKAGYQEATRI